jgi:5-methylcytosine-specific restriction endonuclease McrA
VPKYLKTFKVANFPKQKRRWWQPTPVAQSGRRFTNPFYQSRQWRALQKVFKKQHPWCVECAKNGFSIPTAVVDHIRPINQVDAYDTQGGTYGHPLEWKNLQSLCVHCHAKKSGCERHQKTIKP